MNEHRLRLRRVFLGAMVLGAGSLAAQQSLPQSRVGSDLAERFSQHDNNGDVTLAEAAK
ncbi:MAG TPA: hypothetical protein PKM73_14820 [Verrucomicrobiota bacterium]|nr:hypothetical protein [Verrucomicrobiota bacterium]HNU52895.1 hypothetical protein [Verrucomicrobiota bacterium]